MAINDSKFAVQLLEKIGAPLMGAVNEVVADDAAAQEQAAQITAQLLSQSVQMGTLLFQAVDIQEPAEQADNTRVALTSLCAPLIADFYKQNKAVPSDEDIKRMVQSLEGILSFGENFSPAASAQSRLQTIDHHDVLFDTSQPSLVMLQSAVPVINAVEEFPFGQAPRKLVQDIVAKLEARAKEIAQKQNGSDKLHELLIFKSLASLYAQCHRDEVKRASEGSADNSDALSLDPVWAQFETKLSMAETLLGLDNSQSGAPQESTSGSSEGQAAPAQAAPEGVTQQAPAAVAASPVADSAGAAAGAGPMGFFKKPKEGGDALAPEATPQQAPQETASVSPAPADTASDAPQASASASPMGFFKKPKDSGDDSA